MNVTWLGHSTVLIQLDGTTLITDPVLGKWVAGLVRIAPPVAPGAADGVDLVLVSHLHADHAHSASLRAVGREATVLGPPGSARWLRGRKLANVEELGPGEELAVGPLRVRAVPAVHEGRRHALADRSGSVGFVVHGSRSAYFAGDTDLYPEMADIASGIDLDLALLPVSGWGPTLPPGHMNAERAARAAALLHPRVAIPIHWGTLALPLKLGRPPDPERPAREFEALAARSAPQVEVRVLAPGEHTTVD
jgi:L-ascorbate metabolism protein UlaG (beta-lactamase superfamily)